jgi:hypothetical protein
MKIHADMSVSQVFSDNNGRELLQRIAKTFDVKSKERLAMISDASAKKASPGGSADRMDAEFNLAESLFAAFGSNIVSAP